VEVVASTGGLGPIDYSAIGQLGLDLPRPPGILGRHSDDELLRVVRDRRSPGSRRGDRTPVAAESLAVPADHRFWSYDEEHASLSRPQSRQGDPERAIQGREMRPRVSIGIDGKLLSKCDLDKRLIPATSEEREDAPEDRDRKSCCRPHRALILLEFEAQKHPELILAGRAHPSMVKAERNQCGRIFSTDTVWYVAGPRNRACRAVRPECAGCRRQ